MKIDAKNQHFLSFDSHALIGALFIFASAASISATFIASKQAMRELSPLAFTPLWFATASLWGAIFYLFWNGVKPPAKLGVTIKPLLLLGLLNGTHNLLFFTAINLGDPTLVAFFSQIEIVYSVLLGALFLGERMLNYQWLGVIIAITGTGLITFRAGTVVWLMLFLILVSTFFLSLSTLIAKKYVATVSPLLLSIARTALMTFMLGGIALAAQQFSWPGLTTWLWIIGGAFFGPFLSYTLFYKGLLYLDLGKGVIIRSTHSLFVAIFGLILFGTLITVHQFLGGILMFVGITFMMWQRKLRV